MLSGIFVKKEEENKMKWIDVRLRPPYRSLMGANKMASLEINKNYSDSFGLGNYVSPSRFYVYGENPDSTTAMELLMQEMEEANIGMGFVAPRNAKGATNADVAELIALYPEQFAGFVGISPAQVALGLQEIEQYVLQGNLIGVSMEPTHVGWGASQCRINDASLMPIYEMCEQHQLPFMLAWGGFIGSDYIWTNPDDLFEIINKFPDLKILVNHAGFPHVLLMCHMAYKHPNLFLAPDMYSSNCPGAQDYIAAANYLAPQNFCFGSAYPLLDLRAMADHYKKVIRADHFEDIMYNNAMRFIGREV